MRVEDENLKKFNISGKNLLSASDPISLPFYTPRPSIEPHRSLCVYVRACVNVRAPNTIQRGEGEPTYIYCTPENQPPQGSRNLKTAPQDSYRHLGQTRPYDWLTDFTEF